MPFAIIAVTVLLVSAAAAGVMAAYERAGHNADDATDDVGAIDDAIGRVESHLDRGLGEIIMMISTDDGLGGLEERAAIFDERASGWMSRQFPMSAGGATVELHGFEIDLVSEPMGLPSDLGMDGYVPTYLRGTGSVDVTVRSQSGTARTTIDISTDGSYALPLAAERGSLFESMAGDGGVSLSQMMEYQLTALAQYRVLNGYGGLSAYGDRGTDAIITADDVREAYAICMEALTALCFRDGDRLASEDAADLADLLVPEDGKITLDLAAIYAQAMMAAVDDIALRWMDYFYGFEALEALDRVLNPFRDAIDALDRFLSGKLGYSGAPYLEEVMEANGYSRDDYARPGTGTTTVSAGGFTVTVSNPTADVLTMPWMEDFRHRYDGDGDYVRDAVLDVLRAAAVDMAGTTGLGTVTIEVDPHDDGALLDDLMGALTDAMSGAGDAMEEGISSSLADATVYDEFYGALADEIEGHASDFVLAAELRSRLLAAFSAQVSAAMAEAEAAGTVYDGPTAEELTDAAMPSALSSYRAAVHGDLALFDALRHVESGDGSLVKKVLTKICSFGLRALDILVPVEEVALEMADEVVGISGMNPYEGVIGLPGSTSFELEDDDGNTVIERLDADVTTSDTVVTVDVDGDRSVHTVGFGEDSSAAYSTVFVVTLRGTVQYTVTGTGSMAGSMGSVSSVYSGSFPVDATVEVPVATGWALAGVDYSPSCTVLTDLWDLLLDVLEPVIEPLRKVMEAIRGAFTALAETVIDAMGFVSEQLIRLYNALMDPLAELRSMLEDALEDAITEAVFDILVDVNMGDQSLTLQFFGCELRFETSAITWAANTKTLLAVTLTVPIAGVEIEAGVTAKVRGDLEAENLIITGTGSVEGDGWSVKGKLDPLMKGSKYLVTLDGRVGDCSVSVAAPRLESYYEMGIALSDVPGLGQVIDSIPIPGLGVNVGLDAGFSLRYDEARKDGLIINEYETNPEGTDRGNEWVELLNNGRTTIDLTGYSLTYGKAGSKKTMELSGEISPGEYLVVYPDFTLVNESGRRLTIVGPDDAAVDEVSLKADPSNDDYTWQREFDGSTEWVYERGTMGRSNAGFGGSDVITAAEMKDCVWEGVQRAFDRIESITDLDSLVDFLRYLVRYTVDELIDVVSGSIIDASVYARIDVSDMTSTVTSGIQVAFRTDGDLVEDVLKYVAGQLEELILGIDNPYRIDPVGMFTENIDLEVLFHAGVGFPGILGGDADDLPETDLGVVFRTSLSTLTRIIGADTGDSVTEIGIVARDCPEALIPSKLSAKKGMDHDLWLFLVTVELGRRMRGRIPHP